VENFPVSGEPIGGDMIGALASIVIARGCVSPGEITEAQLDAALDVLGMTGTQQR
jgi:hypothetical protein